MIPGRVRSAACAAGLLAFLASAGAAAGPGPAADGLLVLKDGRVFEGVPMERKDDALLLRFANGEVRVPLTLVEDYIIAGAALPEPATEEEREKRAKGLVPFRGRWVPAAEREKALRKEIDDRRKSIEDHRKHSEWRDRYKFKTRNFEFESTQPPWLNEDYAELLETYFKEFGKIWKTKVPQKWGRLKVCFYGSRKDFQQISGASGGVLAYYRFVEPRELNFYYDRADTEMSVDCLFHEANHYLTALMDPGFRYPHWINEAMAEYYGASTWDPAKKTMAVGGVQQGRLVEVQRDIEDKKLLSIRDMVASNRGAYEHYYWGWSLVHFLMETPKYREKFMRFFADLAQAPDVSRRPSGFPGLNEVKDGEECLRVFLSRLGIKEQGLDALQKEWHAHIEKLGSNAANQLRGYEEAGLRAFHEGRLAFRAPRLLKAAIDKGSTRGQVHVAYAQCLMQKSLAGAAPEGTDPESLKAEAMLAVQRAVALAPLDAEVWAQWALLTYLGGNQPEGERMLALAREIDPESSFLDLELWVKIQAARKELE